MYDLKIVTAVQYVTTLSLDIGDPEAFRTIWECLAIVSGTLQNLNIYASSEEFDDNADSFITPLSFPHLRGFKSRSEEFLLWKYFAKCDMNLPVVERIDIAGHCQCPVSVDDHDYLNVHARWLIDVMERLRGVVAFDKVLPSRCDKRSYSMSLIGNCRSMQACFTALEPLALTGTLDLTVELNATEQPWDSFQSLFQHEYCLQAISELEIILDSYSSRELKNTERIALTRVEKIKIETCYPAGASHIFDEFLCDIVAPRIRFIEIRSKVRMHDVDLDILARHLFEWPFVRNIECELCCDCQLLDVLAGPGFDKLLAACEEQDVDLVIKCEDETFRRKEHAFNKSTARKATHTTLPNCETFGYS